MHKGVNLMNGERPSVPSCDIWWTENSNYDYIPGLMSISGEWIRDTTQLCSLSSLDI